MSLRTISRMPFAGWPLLLVLAACSSEDPGSPGPAVLHDAAAELEEEAAIDSPAPAVDSALEAGKCTEDNSTEACFVCLSASCCAELKACYANKTCIDQFAYYVACKSSNLGGAWSSVVGDMKEISGCAAEKCPDSCKD
ncbi:MAG: hypothetical protein HY898_15300 [Deltaproteobacteria bacterium]|nr:hypothetical protein [Deltaproteobacteria bacterium]